MPGRMVLNALPFCRFCHITFIRKHHLFDRAFSQRFPNMVSFLIIRALTPYINISSQYVFFLAQISDDWSDAWINLAVTFRTLELTHKTHQCGANLQIFSNQKITKNIFSVENVDLHTRYGLVANERERKSILCSMMNVSFRKISCRYWYW